MAEIRETSIPDVLEIHPRIFDDPRGSFFESFRDSWLLDRGIDLNWVQDNQSSSVKGTIRGLHFQRKPYAQDKLVRVIRGRVLDVAVDLRKGSEYFGKTVCVELSAKKHNQLLVPAGFAHGFSVLEDAYYYVFMRSVFECSIFLQ